MKILKILLLVSVLPGCVSTAALQNELSPYVGKDAEVLISVMGLPQEENSIAGRKV